MELKPINEALVQRLVREGGIIAGGQGLGLMVSPKENAKNCPPGWIYLNLEDATPELVEMCLESLQKGRKDWPPAEK